MVIIKPVTGDEAPLLAKLSRETFVETFAEANTPENMQIFLSRQFTEEQLVAETTWPGAWFFIAWESGNAVGYLKLKNHPRGYPLIGLEQPTLEISRIYVLKRSIGKGVGRQLMDYSLNFAAENGYHHICLGVWENNERAIAFYRKYGFEKLDTLPFILGNDHQTDWLMGKKV